MRSIFGVIGSGSATSAETYPRGLKLMISSTSTKMVRSTSSDKSSHCDLKCTLDRANLPLPCPSKMWRIRGTELELNLIICQMLLKLRFQFLVNCLKFSVSLLKICASISAGLPRLAINRWRASKKASVSMELRRSKCTAHVLRHLKINPQHFSFHLPIFAIISPKQSMHVEKKGGEKIRRRADGKSAI